MILQKMATDRVNKNNKEYLQLEDTVIKAKKFKIDLERLLSLNFDSPNKELIQFAKENDLNLSDQNVKESFRQIRDDYIAKINEFYKHNLCLDKVLKPKPKTAKPVQTKISQQKPSHIHKVTKNPREYKPQYLLFLSWVIFFILLAYLAFNLDN
jgi:hypothetical protein